MDYIFHYFPVDRQNKKKTIHIPRKTKLLQEKLRMSVRILLNDKQIWKHGMMLKKIPSVALKLKTSEVSSMNKYEVILMRLNHLVICDFILSLFAVWLNQSPGKKKNRMQLCVCSCVCEWVSNAMTSSLNPQMNLILLPLPTFVLNCRPYYTDFEERGAIKARKQTLLRHFSTAEAHFSVVLRPASSDIQTDNQPDSLTLSRFFPERGGSIRIHILCYGCFS